MKKEIYKAVENLPEELITPEIAGAAIAEGNIKLLDHLPHKYLTGDVIVGIIEKNSDSNSWHSFKLESIPEHLRTKEVCEFAVAKNCDNVTEVPTGLLSESMLKKLLVSAEDNIRYLHLFPESLWNRELVYKGIKSVYSHTSTKYGPRGGYHGTQTTYDIKKVQIFLTYVPAVVKNKEFYLNLFETKLKPCDIDLITPDRYKQKAYYTQIAGKDFGLVPAKFYDYGVFLAALEYKQVSLILPYSYGQSREQQKDASLKHRQLTESIFMVMDDAMADKIIEVEPGAFKSLPEKFQTPPRLIMSIEKCERNVVLIDGKCYPHLFTKEVCEAYTRKNNDVPTLPQSVWTPVFVDYCMEHGTSFRWFKQMPKHLQTREMICKVLKHNSYHLEEVRSELISLEQAQKIYREDNYYKKLIPQHFIREFVAETGLNEKFFGGEVSFTEFRDQKKDYTYCKLEHSYIGIYRERDYGNYPYTLTMTRRTPQSFRPEPVFEREVGTFHSTWLEKMIADYDRTFVKPAVSKALKDLQINGYYNLDMVEKIHGVTIYSNTLLGQTINYAAMIDGKCTSADTLDQIREKVRDIASQQNIDTCKRQPYKTDSSCHIMT